MTPEQDVDSTISSQQVFLAVAVSVTALAVTLGYVVGVNSAQRPVRVFGTVSLPGTGIALAAYGLVLAGSALAVLFILVAAASRREE